MEHKIIEIDERAIYIVNIPTHEDEGSLSVQDAVILRLHEQLVATSEYIKQNGLDPYEPKELAKNKVLRLVGRTKKLLNMKNKKP